MINITNYKDYNYNKQLKMNQQTFSAMGLYLSF